MLQALLEKVARREAVYQVVAQELGFVVLRADLMVHLVYWDEIESVVAFKRDQITVDQICLAFKSRGQEEVAIVTEDDQGYHELCAAMASHLPGIREDWPVAVMGEPFQADVTEVFRREGSHGPHA